MVKTTVYCDHCGREIDPMHDYDDIVIDTYRTRHDADLCRACMDELDVIVGSFLGTKELFAEKERSHE